MSRHEPETVGRTGNERRRLGARFFLRLSTLLLLAAILLYLLTRFAAWRGYETDLFPRWYGLRQLLVHGRDPYAGDVTREIAGLTWFLAGDTATRAGGGALDHHQGVPGALGKATGSDLEGAREPVGRSGGVPGAPGEVTSAPAPIEVAFGFLYPLPGALLLAPLALAPYPVALMLWTALSLVLLPAAAVLALRAWLPEGAAPATGLLAFKCTGNAAVHGAPPEGPTPATGLLAIPLSLFFLPSWANLLLAQPAPLVVFLVAFAAWSSTRGGGRWPAAGGAALAAAAAVKPHLLVLIAPPWLWLHAAGWKRGRPEARAFVLGAAGGAVTLAALALALLPDWPAGFLAAVQAYAQVAPVAPAILAAFRTALPPGLLPLAAPVTAAAAAVVLLWMLAGWRRPLDGLYRSVIATVLLVPPAWETNAVVLLIPLSATLARFSARPRAATAFVAGAGAVTLLDLPLYLTLGWSNGPVLVLAYVAFLAAASLTRSAARAGAAARPVPE